MGYFEGQSVARPLREGSDGLPPQRAGRGTRPSASGPIEWPEEIKRPSPLRWVGLAMFAVLGATVILIGSGYGNAPASLAVAVELGNLGSAPADAAPAVVPESTGRTITFAVPVEGLPIAGRSDAKVTVVAVTDYGCAACGEARAALEGVRTRFGDDVRIAYKPFVTPESRQSMLAVCAAARQGQLARFDAAMWRIGVERVRQLGVPLALPDAEALKVIARDAGLDVARFVADRSSCDYAIRTSRAQLEALHVSPPAYFVNGKLLEGPGALAALPEIVTEELAKATKRIAAGTSRESYYEDWVIELGRTTR